MRSFLAAMAISCAIGIAGHATYHAPVVPLPDLSDLAVVAEPAPTVEPVVVRGPVLLASLHPVTIPIVEEKTFTTDMVPLPRARAGHGGRPDLLAKARKYIGKNPTGWAALWCGKFMAMIAPDLAKRVPNPNMARSWAALPKAKTPARGDIVVLKRGASPDAGHVGVVSGFDHHGNPVVISGNHNRKVAESVYPKSRVIAYVTGG